MVRGSRSQAQKHLQSTWFLLATALFQKKGEPLGVMLPPGGHREPQRTDEEHDQQQHDEDEHSVSMRMHRGDEPKGHATGTQLRTCHG